MMRVHRDGDTLPPVVGSLSVRPPEEYDWILFRNTMPVNPGEQHERFIDALVLSLMEYGVTEVKYLTLTRVAGRDSLRLALGFATGCPKTYQIALPFGAGPFNDPCWVAVEILRQSAACAEKLERSPSPGYRYIELVRRQRERLDRGEPITDEEQRRFAEELDVLWGELSVEEHRIVGYECPTMLSNDSCDLTEKPMS